MMNQYLEGDRQDGDDERRIRERHRATSVAIGQLEQRDIHVRDDADPAAVAELLESVELFEAAVAARGGDSMVNTLDSSRPDRPRFVVPARQADEGIRRYSSRIRKAAEALRGG